MRERRAPPPKRVEGGQQPPLKRETERAVPACDQKRGKIQITSATRSSVCAKCAKDTPPPRRCRNFFVEIRHVSHLGKYVEFVDVIHVCVFSTAHGPTARNFPFHWGKPEQTTLVVESQLILSANGTNQQKHGQHHHGVWSRELVVASSCVFFVLRRGLCVGAQRRCCFVYMLDICASAQPSIIR